MTFDFSRDNEMIIHNNVAEPWRVTIIDTGLNTETGGRIRRIKDYINNEPFMLTYGDGVSDINICDLLEYHKRNGKYATITAIQPGGRFGVLDLAEDCAIKKFTEKSKQDGGWVNGGFMVLEPEVFDYLNDDPKLVFERAPLEQMAKDKQLIAYKYNGFWQCMDTLRDQVLLNQYIESGNAPWMVWENE